MHSSSHFLDRFEELGLSRNEASVYLALLTNHPVTGYKLAKDSGILRPIVYEMLTRLVERGGVKIVKGSPEQYSPISPENFLASLEKRFNDARVSLVNELSIYQNNEKDSDEFWTLTNSDAIISNIQDIAGKAKKEILFFINNNTYAFLLKDILSKKVASGVQVIGFSYRDISLPGTELYSFKVDPSIQHPSIDNERIIITVDSKNSIIADMDAGKACQSMRPAQVITAEEFIRMKIVLYRINQVLNPSKLSLYLFDKDKSLFETIY
ncbi:MAG: TrmB family transcriptional regulator [Brevinema sp.]